MSKPFNCNYCLKKIVNESESGHLSICSHILAPCPNKCGSYVPRIELDKHKSKCLNSIKYASTTDLNGYGATRQISLPKIQPQSGSIFQETIANIQKQLIQQKHECKQLQYEVDLFSKWKTGQQVLVDKLKQEVQSYQTITSQTVDKFISRPELSSTIQQTQIQFNYLFESLYKDQNLIRDKTIEAHDKIEAFKDLYTEDSAATAALWKDLQQNITDIKTTVESITKAQNEQKSKLSNIMFDFRTVSQMAAEAAERVEIQENKLRKFCMEFSQLKLDMEIFEGIGTSLELRNTGKFVWKISEVESKLEEAKTNGSILRSPALLTQDYGYKIRFILYLNGLKKWKDRYALLSIEVLKGEYDLLLKWPCHIEGIVSLKDLENLDEPKPFTKQIVCKKEVPNDEQDEPQESSLSFIFIPHSTLLKNKHVKNGTIFLEFNFEKSKGLETNF